ncbi:unnamed protein product [Sordaria macrospora k-hell]|uniref:WGS project CABT00000000 data, contig 2.2 n=1 Tax=Sordaria macrospora (strain ATCC MYA-333 / DSM 997 / K(L3346) / K-hell) TaxID=771870 RepID=F7VN88_SORMK|nr:uncharacterized protein SMAC_12738 [Sordaria macrospora k-hell]CCC06817.1 unnamed protein product [Sordaria macrospora k-hell]
MLRLFPRHAYSQAKAGSAVQPHIFPHALKLPEKK